MQTTRALFKPAHQPNRALFEAKRLAMANVHLEKPRALHAPLPAFDWEDKWRMFVRKRMPGARDALLNILSLEQQARRMAVALASVQLLWLAVAQGLATHGFRAPDASWQPSRSPALLVFVTTLAVL